MAKRAYIGLGSNLGDRLANLQRATEMLMPAAFPTRVSSVYESKPWGFSSEHLFLNAVVEVQTDKKPRELLTELHKVEYFLGRERNHYRTEENYDDRMIDCDLLWYEDFEFKSGTFEVPHPFACIRAFVLIPWAELDDTIRLRDVRITHWLESLPPDELDHTWLRKDLKLTLPEMGDLLIPQRDPLMK